MMTNAEIWWHQVPQADDFFKSVRNDLLDGKSLRLQGGLPWAEEFLLLLKHSLLEKNPQLDWKDFDSGALRGFGGLISSIAQEYGMGYQCDGTLSSVAADLKRTGAMILWHFSGLEEEQLQEVRRLPQQARQLGLRLAVLFEDDARAPVKGALQKSLTPTALDIQYFAWTMLMQRKTPLTEYGALLAVELSGCDPVRCAELCEQMQALMENPAAVCTWLGDAELGSSVHRAQIRYIEPLLETHRLQLIGELRARIGSLLPFTDDFGNTFTEPEEVELRHLVFWAGNRDPSRQLSLSAQEGRWLKVLYEARNDLAHLKNLTLDRIHAIAAGR